MGQFAQDSPVVFVVELASRQEVRQKVIQSAKNLKACVMEKFMREELDEVCMYMKFGAWAWLHQFRRFCSLSSLNN